MPVYWGFAQGRLAKMANKMIPISWFSILRGEKGFLLWLNLSLLLICACQAPHFESQVIAKVNGEVIPAEVFLRELRIQGFLTSGENAEERKPAVALPLS